MRYSFSFIAVFLSLFVFLVAAQDYDWQDARSLVDDDLSICEFEEIEDLFQRHIESVPTRILARELRSRLDASLERRGIGQSKAAKAKKLAAKLKYPCPHCGTKFVSKEAAKGCTCTVNGRNSPIEFKKY